MDVIDLRTLSVVFAAVAFVAVSWWAFAPRHKKYFDDAAQLPFADEKEERSEIDDEQHKEQEGDRK